MMSLQGQKRVLERTCERFLPKFLQKTGFRRTPALRKKKVKTTEREWSKSIGIVTVSVPTPLLGSKNHFFTS